MQGGQRKRVLLHFFALFCSCYALGVLFLHYSAAGVRKVSPVRGERSYELFVLRLTGSHRLSTQPSTAGRGEEPESAQEEAQTPPPPPGLPSYHFSSQQLAQGALPAPSRQCGKGLLAVQCHLHATPSHSRLVAARNATTFFPSLSF